MNARIDLAFWGHVAAAALLIGLVLGPWVGISFLSLIAVVFCLTRFP